MIRNALAIAIVLVLVSSAFSGITFVPGGETPGPGTGTSHPGAGESNAPAPKEAGNVALPRTRDVNAPPFVARPSLPKGLGLAPLSIQHPFQDTDEELDLAPGDVYSGYLDWCAFTTNTEDAEAYASASGDAADFTSPTYLDSGDLPPGVCSYGDYSITAPDGTGNFTLIWAFGALIGSWEGPPYITISISVIENPSPSETETEVDCAPASFAQDESTTCTADVISYDGNPLTGDVEWETTSPGGTFYSSPCVLDDDSCDVDYVDSEAGNWTITASYAGDANNDPSSDSTGIEVTESNLSRTDTSIECAPSSFNVTDSTTCTATVTGDAPTGVVDWSSTSSDYTFDEASCDLSTSGDSGTCSSTYTDDEAGLHAITGTYAGDDDNLPSSDTTSVRVTNGTTSTSTSVSCSPSPIPVGTSTSCIVTVVGDSPTGVVSFSDTPVSGVFVPEPCTLSDATCSTSYTPAVVGNITIRADYSGDSENEPSTGSTEIECNSSALPTTTEVSATPDSVSVDVATSLIATVTGHDPTGVVVWSAEGIDGNFSGTSCTLSGGTCSLSFTPSQSGVGSLIASYLGDVNNLPSSGSATVTVNGLSTSTAVTCIPQSFPTGGDSTCTATVTGGSFPTGTVSFTDDPVVGGFDPQQCTLADASCSTTYTPTVSGNVTITGGYSGDVVNQPSQGATSLAVQPGPSEYAVTFVETGLDANTTWSVSLDGTSASALAGAGGSSIGFEEENGTFDFQVASVPDYSVGPSSGTVTVAGSPQFVSVTFVPNSPPPESVFAVSFVESGLPSGTSWSVTMNWISTESANTTITFGELNGSYPFEVGEVLEYNASPSGGQVAVEGAAMEIPINFSRTAGNISFLENGLPAGASWGVALGSSSSTTTGGEILFPDKTGTFSWTAIAPTGYAVWPGTGTLDLSGPPGAVVTLNFTNRACPNQDFYGTSGRLSLSQVVACASNAGFSGDLLITFVAVAYQESTFCPGAIQSGKGSCDVTSPGCGQSYADAEGILQEGTAHQCPPSGGAFPVPSYSPSSCSTWSGSDTNWAGIYFNPRCAFQWAHAYYNWKGYGFWGAYKTGAYCDWAPEGFLGTGPESCDGEDQNQANLPWNDVCPFNECALVPNSISFSEAGLPSGSFWDVDLSGPFAMVIGETGSSFEFTIPNGTYTYEVESDAGYSASPSSGTLTVHGSAQFVPISFGGDFPVEFYRPGGGSGSEWSAYVHLTTTGAGPSGSGSAEGISFVEVSSSTTLTVDLPNGTYHYTLTVARDSSLTTSGTFSVEGSKVTANPPSQPPSNGGPFGTGGLLVGALIAGAAIAVIAVALVSVSRRKGKGRTGSGAPPPAEPGPSEPAAREMAVAPPPAQSVVEGAAGGLPPSGGSPPLAQNPLPQQAPFPSQDAGAAVSQVAPTETSPPVFCPKCGTANPGDAQVCRSCGNDFASHRLLGRTAL